MPSVVTNEPVDADLREAEQGLSESDELVRELGTLAARCGEDPDAARALGSLLLELQPRLRQGASVDPDLAQAIVSAALFYVWVDPTDGALNLDVPVAYELADLAARAHPDSSYGVELLASVALAHCDHLRAQGQLDEAAARLEQALLHEPAPRYFAPRLRIEWAESLRFEGRWDRAESLLEQALRELHALPNGDPERASAQLRHSLVLGRMQLDLGLVDQAWSTYRKARALSQALPPDEQIPQQLEEAAFLLASDDAVRAERVADQLLERPDLPAAFEAQALVRRGLARLVAARSVSASTDAAEQDLRAALAKGLSTFDARICRLRVAELELERGDFSGARPSLETLRSGMEDAAAAASRDGPALQRALLEALSSRLLRAERADREVLLRAQRRLRAAHGDLLEQWRQLAPRPGGVGFLHFGVRSEALGELVALELELDDRGRGVETAFELLVDAQALGSLARHWAGSVPPVSEDLQSLLPEGALLLAYLFAPQSGWVFVLDRETVAAYEIEGRWTLLARMRSFAELFSSSPGSLSSTLRQERRAEIDMLARDLCRRLLPEEVLERVLAADHVTVVGASQLARLPFEALRLADGRWMGAAAAIDHWPSVPVGFEIARRLGTRAASEDELVLGFAATEHEPILGAPLKLETAEHEALERAWPGLQLWTGAAASEHQLRSADFASARALLFLVHGVEDPDRPLPLGLVLSAGSDGEDERCSDEFGDGIVWSDDVLALDSEAPPLVVLGVCGAGRGPQRRGEDGSAHVGGAWIQRGAQCVVLSAFDLEESTTRAQLVTLGEALARGESVAEALRIARARLARERPNEPYYHQLLQVMGVGW